MCLEMKSLEIVRECLRRRNYVLFVDLTFACFSLLLLTRPTTERSGLDYTGRHGASCYAVACTYECFIRS
jgi:hypothetical protein